MKPCVTGRWARAAAMLDDAALAAAMAHPAAPWLELRLDLLADASPAALRALVARFGPDRVVATARGGAGAGADKGGVSPLALHARLGLWRAAHALGVAYVDVDADVWLADAELRRDLLAPGPRGRVTRVVVSWHDWDGVPPLAALRRRFAAAAASGAAVVKLACQIESASAAEPLLRLAAEKTADQPGAGPAPALLPLAMGAAGSFSRWVLARARPLPPFTYCALAHGAGTAQGQPTLAEILETSGLELAPAGPVYAVVGAPLVQSRSPALHRRVLAAYGLPGTYVALEEWGPPARLLRRLAPLLGLRGASVTAPHKAAVLALCRRSTALARQAGAVNTLTWAPTRVGDPRPWHGRNTDGPALRRSVSLLLGAPLAGRRCLVLGTGGTAAVALAALGAAGARLGVWGRRAEAAQALARVHGAEAVAPAGLAAALAHAEVVVHATSVGMAPDVDACLLSHAALRQLPAHAVVYDAIYAPTSSALVRRARARGLRALGGTGMFLRQAQGQCAAFYGVRPPLKQLFGWMHAG